MQILASGKTGAQRYDDNNVSKPVPDLDLISIGQTNQRAFEETQGWSYSNNKGSTDSQATNLSVIEEGDVNDYNSSLAQLIQTYVANNSYLDVNGSSTANNIILEPRKIADVNSPNGVNYSKTTSLPFAFRDNLRFCFRATATNTGAVQFSITGLSGLSGAIDSLDENGNTLTGGEIVSGKFYEIVLTGTATTKKVILLNSDSFDNLTINNKLNLNSNTETIASGSVSYVGINTTLRSEGAAATDDLDNITGGTTGDIVLLKTVGATEIITIRDNGVSGGNIALPNNNPITLSNTGDFVMLFFRGSFWYPIAIQIAEQNVSLKELNLQPQLVTISAGAIPYSGTYMVVDTEGGASSDDLETISGGSVGDVVKIRSNVNSRDITIKSSTGNILLPNDEDTTLSRSENSIELMLIGSFWVQTSRSVTNDFTKPAAWISFDGSGTPSINNSFNVSSITDLGTGYYRINFANSLSNSNYCALIAINYTSFNPTGHIIAKNASYVEVATYRWNSGTTQLIYDATEINVIIFEKP